MNKKRIKIILAAAVVIGISILLMKYMPKLLLITVSLEEFKKYILSMGHSGILVLMFFQALQTVIAPIPGEVIQIAGGYLYGISLGTLYSVLGLVLGAAIAFYFTRFFGREYIVGLTKKKNFKWISNVMESKKFEIIVFIIFIVPGLPKDFMIYVAGVTAMRSGRFFAILVMGRLPWIMASAGIGANINAGNYFLTILITVISVIGFIVGMVYKEKIIKKLTKED